MVLTLTSGLISLSHSSKREHSGLLTFTHGFNSGSSICFAIQPQASSLISGTLHYKMEITGSTHGTVVRIRENEDKAFNAPCAQRVVGIVKISCLWNFPGGPVAEVPCSQYRGPGFDSWSGN